MYLPTEALGQCFDLTGDNEVIGELFFWKKYLEVFQHKVSISLLHTAGMPALQDAEDFRRGKRRCV